MRQKNKPYQITHGVGEMVWILHVLGSRGKDRDLFYSQNATTTFSKYLAEETKTRSLNDNSNKKNTFQYFKCVAMQGGDRANQRNMPHIPAANVLLTTDRDVQHWLLWEPTQ